MAATAAQILRGAWSNKQVRVSHNIDHLASRQVNIVHIRRPEAAVNTHQALQLLTKPNLQAVLAAANPDAAISYLLSAVHHSALQQQIHDDLQQAVQQICIVQQTDHVRAKLELITKQSCPKFHADTVGVRLLCTYTGQGTWYIQNRHVSRRYNPWTGDAPITGVDEQYAVQAAAGDLLYLKGNLSPGLLGKEILSPQKLQGFDMPAAPTKVGVHNCAIGADELALQTRIVKLANKNSEFLNLQTEAGALIGIIHDVSEAYQRQDMLHHFGEGLPIRGNQTLSW